MSYVCRAHSISLFIFIAMLQCLLGDKGHVYSIYAWIINAGSAFMRRRLGCPIYLQRDTPLLYHNLNSRCSYHVRNHRRLHDPDALPRQRLQHRNPEGRPKPQPPRSGEDHLGARQKEFPPSSRRAAAHSLPHHRW